MSNLYEVCNKAIVAHASWKHRFKSMLAGDSTLDAAKVRRHDACDFGQWLESKGKGELGARFQDIHKAHAHFHVVAAGVVEAHRKGERDVVTQALALGGDFTKAGSALTALVTAARDASA